MNRLRLIFLLPVLFLCTSHISIDKWEIKSDESYVNFRAKAAFGDVEGKIPNVQGEIYFEENNPENSSFNAWIEPQQLNTENGKRDKHLRSDDFLHVEQYPLIKFKSKKIEKTDSGYQTTGDLTIKEVTKEITFPFTFEQKEGAKGTFKGSFTINRRDYNVGGKTKLAGDIINIDIVAEVYREG